MTVNNKKDFIDVNNIRREVELDDLWIENSDLDYSSAWRVVGLEDNGLVHLSGPGPCRAMRYIYSSQMLESWVRLK